MIGRLSGRRAFAAFNDPSVPHQRVRTTSLWCRFNESGEVPLRVAYAIGKRYGGAVQRNRLRRQLRALVAEVAPQHELGTGALLIGAQPSAAGLTFGALRDELNGLFSRLQQRRQR